MARKQEYIDSETYEMLQNMATALVGHEECNDLAQDAALTTLISQKIYPNKPLIILLRESLGVNYAKLFFERMKEEDSDIIIQQEYVPVRFHEGHKKIILRNTDKMSDLEKLVALRFLKKSDLNELGEHAGVGVSCINAYLTVIAHNINRGVYK